MNKPHPIATTLANFTLGGLPPHAHTRSSSSRRAKADQPIDEEAYAAVARVRPWLTELLTLWPKARASEIVLSVRALGGETLAGAKMRATLLAEAGDVAPRVGKIRNDVPVVVELEGQRTVVAPLRALLGH